MFKPSSKIGKKGDFSDFERVMVIGAKRAGLSIYLIYWDFHTRPQILHIL